MLKLDIRGVNAYPLEKESITAGRIGLQILFTFSDDWKDLSKIAVFEGAEKVELLLTNPRCVVPEECLKTAGPSLRVGVYGIDSLGTVATPTVWANFGRILSSAQVSLTYEPGVTPPMIAQILSAAQSAVNVANSVRSDADAGEFDGVDGKDGSAIWRASAAPTHVTPSGKPEFDYYLDSSLTGPGDHTPAIGDLVFYNSSYYPIIAHLNAYGIGVISVVGAAVSIKGATGDSGAYIVTYGETTVAQIDEAVAAGKIPVFVYQNRWYNLAKVTTSPRTVYTFTFLDTDGMLYWAQCYTASADTPTHWSFGSKDLGGNSI